MLFIVWILLTACQNNLSRFPFDFDVGEINSPFWQQSSLSPHGQTFPHTKSPTQSLSLSQSPSPSSHGVNFVQHPPSRPAQRNPENLVQHLPPRRLQFTPEYIFQHP